MSSKTVISKIGIAVLALRIKANEELAAGREAVIMAGLRVVAARPQFEIRYEIIEAHRDGTSPLFVGDRQRGCNRCSKLAIANHARIRLASGRR
jgi:hypothetical protein